MNEANQTSDQITEMHKVMAAAISRAATKHSAARAEMQRQLGQAIIATINEPTFRAMFERLVKPLVALMSGPLADLAAALARESRRRAGAEREANSKAIQLLAHTQRSKGNGR